MQNLWDPVEAEKYQTPLELRVYSSRLLGQDKSLVLHGGGNTSVKIEQTNILGKMEQLLYVKGSGWDLETIESAGFTAVQMRHLLKLAELDKLSDSQMVNELKTHQVDANAPTPSVETILHALLPYKYVDHTHADAIVSITNTADGEHRIRQIYGDTVVIIPYVMPGFDLSKLCARFFPDQQNENTIGMVLLNHGIFSFADTAQESYNRMISLVDKAEKYLQQKKAWSIVENDRQQKTLHKLVGFGKKLSSIASTSEQVTAKLPLLKLAELRNKLSQLIQQPVLLLHNAQASTMDFCQQEQLARISQQGPATPDHVIRTKRLPLVTDILDFEQDLKTYVDNYEIYFKQFAKADLKMLDQAPRVILDARLGLFCVGKNKKEANIIMDIYQHSMNIIRRAEMLRAYQALDAKDIFDVEYWELEQAKLKKDKQSLEFSGEIALVTGAASGIGKACVESLLAKGATVVGLDINEEISQLFPEQDFLAIQCDLTDESQINQAIEQTIRTFSGLDMLILNAGIFPKTCLLENMQSEHWRTVMAINCDANMQILKQSYAYLKLAPKGGRVAVIGSKNVPAPGPGASAYSVSKAALNQLIRVTAMEWGKDNIRLNSVHPNAVFDTAIWDDEILKARAEHYKMSIEEYKANNLLKTQISAKNVAELAVSLCGELYSKTTAAQIPVDGGNDRVI